ncbi:MAG: hypothetical protein KIT84_24120 [Labilithrix sp.]|nr:hypothetical protein [Labilithrix sp.]MCW5814137.1 hypothetical protein [Labilithrix sp.]
MKPKPAQVCVVVALAGALVRLALAFRDETYLDRLFVPDDTYYTLAIARSIARGLGPSADGAHLTNGFQPLLAFLLVPIASLRGALAIGAIADGVTAWCLGLLARRSAGSDVAAVAATTIWALSPSAVAVSSNGLETSLTIACVTGALVLWQKDTSRWLTGAALGLCLLARVDTVFVVVAVGVLTLRRDGLRATWPLAAGAAAVVAPWWIYSLSRFGTFVPESGAAVREQAMMYRAAGMVIRDQVAWAAGAIVGPPFVDWTPLREFLGKTASGIGLVIGVLCAGAAVWLFRRTRDDVVRAALAYALALFAFYSLYLPATWFFRRYLAPIHAVTALVVALHVRRRAWAGWCLLALVAIGRLALATPVMTIDQGHHGAKGYREPARQVLALAPPGAVVGSFQSGALAWFADGTGRAVVNLDGVVDREAARAVREHHLAAFARSRGVTHFADWEVNVKRFRERAGDATFVLRRVGEAEPQGRDERFVLYAIDWPD